MLYDNHHRHTDMSLLDAVTKIPKIVERLKQTGHTSVTITDHGTLAGTYKNQSSPVNVTVWMIMKVSLPNFLTTTST